VENGIGNSSVPNVSENVEKDTSGNSTLSTSNLNGTVETTETASDE
jgi:hypothetical protein